MVVRRSSGLNSADEARARERAGLLARPPRRRLRQPGPHDEQRQGGDQPGDQGVAPGRVPAADRRQRVGVADGEPVDPGHEQAAERGEGLRVAEHLLAARRIGEQLRQPRRAGDELDADADEDDAAQRQQLPRAGDEGRRERAAGIEQDAPHQHPPPAEAIGQPAAEQAEGGAEDRRHVEEPAHPDVHLRAARLHAEQLGERRRPDQRQHQQLVGVEQEPDGRHRADQPLERREAELRRCGGLGPVRHARLPGSAARRMLLLAGARVSSTHYWGRPDHAAEPLREALPRPRPSPRRHLCCYGPDAALAAEAAAAAEDAGDALRRAASAGDLAKVTELLAAGTDVNAANPYGGTALAFACDHGHAAVVDLLLARGANVNAEDSYYHSTPLGWAVSAGTPRSCGRCSPRVPRARRKRWRRPPAAATPPSSS